MSEWTTDRLPTKEDSDIMGMVWIFEDNAVYWSAYSVVTRGTPWMPIKEPKPYVAITNTGDNNDQMES